MPRLTPPRGETPHRRRRRRHVDAPPARGQPCPSNADCVRLRGRQLLEFVGATTPIDQISRSSHEDLLASLQARGWKPFSVSAVYRPLRTFWRFVVEHDDLPVAKGPMNGMRAPAVPEQTVEFLSDAELRFVLGTCAPRSRHSFRGRRDEAIIRLLATTGARLSEPTSLLTTSIRRSRSSRSRARVGGSPPPPRRGDRGSPSDLPDPRADAPPGRAGKRPALARADRSNDEQRHRTAVRGTRSSRRHCPPSPSA
jgi:hypothetical protein